MSENARFWDFGKIRIIDFFDCIVRNRVQAGAENDRDVGAPAFERFAVFGHDYAAETGGAVAGLRVVAITSGRSSRVLSKRVSCFG